MLIAAAELAQQMTRYDRMGWDDGTPWGMVILMIVLALLVVGAIVWAVVYTSRNSQAPTSAPPPAPGSATPAGPSAREILDERYARGEIDTADYEERRSKLT